MIIRRGCMDIVIRDMQRGVAPLPVCEGVPDLYIGLFLFFLRNGPRVEIAQQPLQQRLIDSVRV